MAEVPDEGPAHLVEVLGADDRPEWDDAGVASQFRLRTRFPDGVLAEAAACREPGAAERHGRLDLREALVFSVDPEDARDHDDALSLRPAPAGRFEVGVHIADVSHYVRPGGALDAEALARGTSCYLPGGAVPMLPEALSADLCSLRPDRDRLALSVLAEVDREGNVFGWRFAETVVRSRHRLHYGEVQAALDGARPFPPELQRDVERLMGVARALRRRRLAAGALELDVPEVKAWVDERGVPWRIERRPHLESHELVEEFMLLANRCVGEEGARRRAGLLYRVHEAPSPGRLADLDVMLGALGRPWPCRPCCACRWTRRAGASCTAWCCARWPAPATRAATSGTSGWRRASTATSPRPSGATPTCTTTDGSASGSAAARTRPGTRWRWRRWGRVAAPRRRRPRTPSARRCGSRGCACWRGDSGTGLRV